MGTGGSVVPTVRNGDEAADDQSAANAADHQAHGFITVDMRVYGYAVLVTSEELGMHGLEHLIRVRERIRAAIGGIGGVRDE